MNGKGGGELHVSSPVNEHEKRWRDYLYDVSIVFERSGFSSADLCGKGKPFSSNTHWVLVTNIMRDNELILKDNGDTTLPNGEWGDIRTRIQDSNHPLKLPAHLPPH